MNAVPPVALAPLDLAFATRGGQTVLAQRHVTYPFFVTAPLRGRGPAAEIILQSVSGGLFGDEQVAQRIAVGDGASAVIRMPSATIVHDRRDKAASRFAVSLRVGAGASLHYLPRPVILLPGSGLSQSIDLSVGAGSTTLLQDGVLMHDPATITAAPRSLDSRISIRDSYGRLIALDRMRMTDDDITLGVTGAYRAFGTIWLVQEMPSAVYQTVKAALSSAAAAPCYWGITPLRAERGAMIRIAAADGGDLDMAMTAFRQALVTTLDGQRPVLER
jgi:urease accessory protein